MQGEDLAEDHPLFRVTVQIRKRYHLTAAKLKLRLVKPHLLNAGSLHTVLALMTTLVGSVSPKILSSFLCRKLGAGVSSFPFRMPLDRCGNVGKKGCEAKD